MAKPVQFGLAVGYLNREVDTATGEQAEAFEVGELRPDLSHLISANVARTNPPLSR